MKLYLSSMYLGNHSDRLLHMAGGAGARMAIITNALDDVPLEAQIDYARTQFDPIEYFADHGFDPSIVDLRFYFDRPMALLRALMRSRVIWALGGNTFLLRRAMRKSGFDGIIDKLLQDESRVYAGWSAGACVAGNSLRALELMDDPRVLGPGYDSSEPVWDGLGLVPFTVIPHYESDHAEVSAAQAAVAWAVENGVNHVALSDGNVIVCDGAAGPEVLT